MADQTQRGAHKKGSPYGSYYVEEGLPLLVMSRGKYK